MDLEIISFCEIGCKQSDITIADYSNNFLTFPLEIKFCHTLTITFIEANNL